MGRASVVAVENIAGADNTKSRVKYLIPRHEGYNLIYEDEFTRASSATEAISYLWWQLRLGRLKLWQDISHILGRDVGMLELKSDVWPPVARLGIEKVDFFCIGDEIAC